MLKLILFDLDGTLFDTKEDIADAVNFGRGYYNLPPLAIEKITSMVGDGVNKLIERAFEDSTVPFDSALNKMMEHYIAHPSDKSRFYPFVEETLKQISITKVIVSNKPIDLVRALTDKFSISNLFSHMIGGECMEKRKPDPMAVDFLIDKFKVERDEILMVGDHKPDIGMAKAANIKSVFCKYGFSGVDSIGADYSIDRFDELLDIIEELS